MSSLPQVPLRTVPLELLAGGAIAVPAVAGIALLGMPELVLIALLAAVGAVACLWRWGREGPLLGVIVLAPLIPIAEGGSFGALGDYGSDLRAGVIALGTGLYLIPYLNGVPALPRALRGTVVSLLALAAIALPVALLNSTKPADLFPELSHGIGQPLLYALFIFAVAAALRSRPQARERILAAFAIAILAQAAIVAAEFATGAAFDAVRGVTRAQGTVGANFLSAMAMLGFFTGLSLRTGSVTRMLTWLGTATILASGMILVLATTRGGFIGLIIGVGYLLFVGLSPRARRVALGAAAATIAVVLLVPPVAELWTSRLDEQGIAGFDRAATWVSGTRMGLDDPLTGLGTLGVEKGIETNLYYRLTPFGYTSVVPHNIWVLGFAEGGVPTLLGLVVFSFFAVLAVLGRPRPSSGPDRYLVAGLLAVASVAMVNNLFTHPEVMIPAFAVLTVLCGPVPSQLERRRSAAAGAVTDEGRVEG